MRDTGYEMRDARYEMRDAGFEIRGYGMFTSSRISHLESRNLIS